VPYIVLTPLAVMTRISVTHRRGASTHRETTAFREAITGAVERYVAQDQAASA